MLVSRHIANFHNYTSSALHTDCQPVLSDQSYCAHSQVLFELARFHAPSTIFMDELESIMGQRAGFGSAGWVVASALEPYILMYCIHVQMCVLLSEPSSEYYTADHRTTVSALAMTMDSNQ